MDKALATVNLELGLLAQVHTYIRTYIHTYLVAAEPSHHLELQQVVWEHVNHIQNELVALSVVSAGHNHQKAHQAPMYVCKYHCLLHSINCVICTYNTYCAYCNTYVRMYITLYCFVRDEWANDIIGAHCYEFKSSEVMSIHSARVQKNCSGMMFRPRWSSPLPVILSFVPDEDFY